MSDLCCADTLVVVRTRLRSFEVTNRYYWAVLGDVKGAKFAFELYNPLYAEMCLHESSLSEPERRYLW